ncbi:hypothetical protein CKAH01_04237 [Colletotrichum kahawae]|uniref:Uncharacterized protein n=1 Tax=Colletotrichum kahawae TaxID=34407 RepID=A0AAE0DA09_COLKA|nr:hypothetical protein CKAH01_04237 [Colletotrichum kahawae]
MTRQAVQYLLAGRTIGQTTSGIHVTHNCTHYTVLNTVNQNESSTPLNPTPKTTEPSITHVNETLADDIGSMPFWMMFGGPEPPDRCGSQLSPHTLTSQPLDFDDKLEERLGDKMETFQDPGLIVTSLFRILLDPGIFPSPPSSITVSGRLAAQDYANTKDSYTSMVKTYVKMKRHITTTHMTAVCNILKKDGAHGVVKNFESDMLSTMSYVGVFDEDTLAAISKLPGVAKVAYVRADGKR